jgi:hypothetical protein
MSTAYEVENSLVGVFVVKPASPLHCIFIVESPDSFLYVQNVVPNVPPL